MLNGDLIRYKGKEVLKKCTHWPVTCKRPDLRHTLTKTNGKE